MYSEVLRIIEGGLHNDVRKIVNYSQRLATHFESDGDVSMAKSIYETLEVNTVTENDEEVKYFTLDCGDAFNLITNQED